MGWDVGNYTPMPHGTPFDFALLSEGFERLRAAGDEYVYWYCSACEASGKTKQKPQLCPVCNEPL